MIKDFDYFLTADHFFNIAVQLTKALLLFRIKNLTFCSAEFHIPEHDTIADRHDQRQFPVQDIQDHKGSDHLDKTLDCHRKTVIESICDRINIVCEQTHDIAVSLLVKKAKRQCLHMCKQISSNIKNNLLGSFYHRLRIAPGCQCSDGKNAGCHKHSDGK